jgi:hypothetical protein
MITGQAAAYLRYVHGAFNLAMVLLFLYQGSLGLRIRRGRLANSPVPRAAGRHRRLGPVLAPLGALGFLAGLALVFLDKGRVFEHPLHFLGGLAVAALITVAFLLSRRIRGLETPWRAAHFRTGAVLLLVYPVQALLGLGILL